MTLRVVRWTQRGRSSRASRRRIASLSPDADEPVTRAASRKPPASTTAIKVVKIVELSVHCTKYRTGHATLHGLSCNHCERIWRSSLKETCHDDQDFPAR